MEIKRTFDIAAEIIKATNRNETAQPPARFHLPFSVEQVFNLLGAYYKAEVLKRIKAENYVALSDVMKANIKDVATWLCDPNKRPGLLLFGNVGTGKTTLLYAISSVINRAVERERDEDNRFKETLDGYNTISVIKAKRVISESTNPQGRYNIMLSTSLLAIDELGVEPTESKIYGNVSEPLIDLLCERYDRQLCTIISTNMGAQEITERYGRRVSDRFNEMFATIPFTAESYRV